MSGGGGQGANVGSGGLRSGGEQVAGEREGDGAGAEAGREVKELENSSEAPGEGSRKGLLD